MRKAESLKNEIDQLPVSMLGEVERFIEQLKKKGEIAGKPAKSLSDLSAYAIEDDLPADLAEQHDHYLYGTDTQKVRRAVFLDTKIADIGGSMSKLILMILVFVSNSAAAELEEWVYVVEGNKETIYASPSSIHKDGNKVKMWSIQDYKMPKSVVWGSVYSIKVQVEYDCKEELSRLTYFSAYSKNMAKGEILYSSTSIDDWTPSAPDSTGIVVFKYACKS
jgi:hypothetical protein